MSTGIIMDEVTAACVYILLQHCVQHGKLVY